MYVPPLVNNKMNTNSHSTVWGIKGAEIDGSTQELCLYVNFACKAHMEEPLGSE